jgi:hypothetical protein
MSAKNDAASLAAVQFLSREQHHVLWTVVVVI